MKLKGYYLRTGWELDALSIYTSLIICTKNGEHTISKSLSTQHLADVDRELKALLTGNITDN